MEQNVTSRWYLSKYLYMDGLDLFFFLGVCLRQLEFIFSLDWVCLCEFVRMFKPAKRQYHKTESYNRLGLKAFGEDSKLLEMVRK